MGGTVVFVRILSCSILASLGMTPKRHVWSFLDHDSALDNVVLDTDLEIQPVLVDIYETTI